MLPKARDDDLIVHPLGDEIVVYDVKRHDAHRLNQIAAQVWRNCNGARTPAELAALVRDDLTSEADENTVLHALHVLGGAHLLMDDIEPEGQALPDRREFLRKLATYGAPAAVAVIWSISSPTVAHAQSTSVCPMEDPQCPEG